MCPDGSRMQSDIHQTAASLYSLEPRRTLAIRGELWVWKWASSWQTSWALPSQRCLQRRERASKRPWQRWQRRYWLEANGLGALLCPFTCLQKTPSPAVWLYHCTLRKGHHRLHPKLSRTTTALASYSRKEREGKVPSLNVISIKTIVAVGTHTLAPLFYGIHWRKWMIRWTIFSSFKKKRAGGAIRRRGERAQIFKFT